ncbi:MAG TPA: NAD-dependent epimerase/dehydratase family protein [Candidatus Eisenbacteria bacterium]
MRTPFIPERLLVTGSTGAVGRAIATVAASWRAPVRLLTHRAPVPPSVVAALPGAELRSGDLAHPETLRGIADGCDVVVHAATRGGFAPLDQERRRQVNVGGTEALLREATGAGVKTFVLVGYTGTIQERERRDVAVDEETPPEGEYEIDTVRHKMEAEALVLEANGTGGLRAMVVSPGVALAPDADTLLGGLIRVYRDGDLPYRVLDEVWLALSDARDLPRFVAAAIERGQGGRRYFATSDCVRLGDLYRRLHALSGIEPPRRRLPDLLVEELGLLTPVLPPHSYLRRLVLPREMVLHLRRLAPLTNARTQTELGVAPTPLETTLRDVLGAREGEGEGRGRAAG